MPGGCGGVAGVRARRRRRRRALRGRRAARALRDEPRRRRDADRAPRAHRAGGARARGPAAALRRARGRRRPLGRPDAGDRGARSRTRRGTPASSSAARRPARPRARRAARGMLRGMEPDSLLVRGLVDNPSRGLSPALDRSTTFERVPGGPRPTAVATHPSPPRRRRSSARLEDAEATVFASGMTAWTGVCLTVLGQGKVLVIPTSGYYEVELLGAKCSRASASRCAATTCATPRASAAPAKARRSRSSSRPPTRRSRHRHPAAAAAAHAGGALLCCDNTFGTPLVQRPLDLGADLAWQSATKYLGGHSDLLAGLVTTRDSALRERLVWTRRTSAACSLPTVLAAAARAAHAAPARAAPGRDGKASSPAA